MEESRNDGFPSKLFSTGTMRLLLFMAMVSGLVWLIGETWAMFAFMSIDSGRFEVGSFDKIQAFGRIGFVVFQLCVWGILVSVALTARDYLLERSSGGG